MIEVIATRTGYYGGVVRHADGKPFTVEKKEHVSKRWMAEVGSAKAEDFMRALNREQPEKMDKITGERITSGGVAEQLAVALEENRKLAARIAELEAEKALLQEAVPPKKVETVTPAESEKAAAEETTKPVQRRRRRKTEDA